MLTHTRPAIPGPRPGPDPLTALRAARAFLLRLVAGPCPALEQLIRDVGALAAAEQLYNGDIPETLAEHVTPTQVRAAAAAARVDGETADRCGARLLIPEDRDQWPATLAPAGPLGLWVRGHADLALLSAKMVCLAGSSTASSYGATVAGDLAGELATAGYTLVTGTGFGIEAAAVRGALAAGGRVVGVLGCGIDRAYPVAHEALLDRIAEAGLLVAAQPPGTTPGRHGMAGRARLLAGLGHATVVVEAGARSGALGIAAAAHTFGRPVMGVPGPVSSVGSAGPHQLISTGAALVTNGSDVADRLDADTAAAGA